MVDQPEQERTPPQAHVEEEVDDAMRGAAANSPTVPGWEVRWITLVDLIVCLTTRSFAQATDTADDKELLQQYPAEQASVGGNSPYGGLD